MATLTLSAASRLERRERVELDPARGVAIKRNTHEFEIEVDARSFADALHAAMIEPGADFAGIELKRCASRDGQPFCVGERFHGCFRLRQQRGTTLVRRWLRALGSTRLGTWIEDTMLSDYAEITELQMQPDLDRGEAYRVVYRYLRGTIMAGQSTFLIEPRSSSACRFRAVFEYQERGTLGIFVLNLFGIRAHDAVVWSQVYRAADALGAPVLCGTVQPHYVFRARRE